MAWVALQKAGLRGGADPAAPAISEWPNSRDLLEAVQLLVGAGSSMWAAGNPGAMYVVHTAAQRGDLALVQHLVQELQHLGCRLDAATVEYAAQGGCEALLEGLVGEYPQHLGGASPVCPCGHGKPAGLPDGPAAAGRAVGCGLHGGAGSEGGVLGAGAALAGGAGGADGQ